MQKNKGLFLMICVLVFVFFLGQGSSADAQDFCGTARIDIYKFYGDISSVNHSGDVSIEFGHGIPVEYHDFCPAEVRGLIFYPFHDTGSYEYSTDGVHFYALCEGTEIAIVEQLIVRKAQETPGETPGENPDETPGDNPDETPGDNPDETPGDNPDETPGDNPDETPGDNTEEDPPEEIPGGSGEETPETYLFTFLKQTGEVLEAVAVAANSTLTDIPRPPEVDLHTFQYWTEAGTSGRAVFSALPAIEHRVFEPYYEKTSARITFCLGALASSIVVPIGGCVSPPDLHAPEGYLAVWREDPEGLDFDFSVPVADDSILYAGFVPKTYTVRFLLGDGQAAGGTPLIQSVSYNGAASAPMVIPPPGKRHAGWDKDFSKVTSNLIVQAVYEELSCVVTLSFLPGCSLQLLISYGDKIEQPDADAFEIPVPKGYYLSGWKEIENGQYFDFGSPIRSSKTLIAVFERIRLSIQYFDGFCEITGEGYPSCIDYGAQLAPPPAPIKPGAEFEGWYDTKYLTTMYNFYSPVVEDICLYARYSLRYFVTAEVSEGIQYTLSASEGRSGEEITFSYILPEGYLLETKEVSVEGQIYALTENRFALPNADIILHLILSREKYALAIRYGGAEASAVYGEPFLPCAPLLEEHEVFCGWFLDQDFLLPYEGSIKAPYGQTTFLYPKIEKESFEIVFVYGYGGNASSTAFTFYNELPLPPDIMQQDFIRFEGWDKEIVPAEASARYTALYTLLFDKYYYDGDTLLITVREALAAAAPLIPGEKEGKIFDGYLLESVDTGMNRAVYRASYSAIPAGVVNPENGGNNASAPEALPSDSGFIYQEAPLIKFHVDAKDPFLLTLACAAIALASVLLTNRYLIRKKENLSAQK